MRIDRVEVFNLHMTYPGGRGFRYAGGVVTGRVSTLVRITTDTGMIGWGASYAYPDIVRTIIERNLAPHLIGEDPAEIESLWSLMYGLTRWYGRKGAAMAAISGIDIALWDLRGKAAGKPLHALLGGQLGTVPAYASALFWQDDPTALEAEATRHRERGFRRVKTRLGRSWDYDLAALAAIRRGLNGGEVMVDGSHRYDLHTAERMGRVLAEHRAVWFEEPFPPEDLHSYREFRARCPVPLALGENEFGLQGFRDLVGAVDIAQADACRAGGISECRRIATFAAKHGLRVAPHTWSDAVALAANAHLVASLAHGMTVEMDQTGNPFIDELLVEPLQVKDGLLRLSDRPGLGIEVDERALERLSLPAGKPIPDGNYSDLIFGKQHRQDPPPYRAAPSGRSEHAHRGRAALAGVQ